MFCDIQCLSPVFFPLSMFANFGKCGDKMSASTRRSIAYLMSKCNLYIEVISHSFLQNDLPRTKVIFFLNIGRLTLIKSILSFNCDS